MNTTSHDGNGNIVEQTVDNGDGTGTRTVFDADGNVTSVEQLTGLPIPVDPEPTAEERLATDEPVTPRPQLQPPRGPQRGAREARDVDAEEGGHGNHAAPFR